MKLATMDVDKMEASFIRIGVTAPLATIEESDTDTDGSSESDVEEEEDGVGVEAKAASIEPLAPATREPLSRTRLTLLTLLTPPVLVIVKARSVNT